jgi:hypothetical protein
LHIQAANSKSKKLCTVVLLLHGADALAKQLAGRSKGGLFMSHLQAHVSSRQVQNILVSIAARADLQEGKRKDEAGKDRHQALPHPLRTALLYGVLMAEQL